MASKISTSAVLRNILKRNLSAEAAPKFAGSIPSSNVSVLPSQTIVASVAPEWPLSEVSISFKAGARHETGEFIGVNHVLRSVSGLSTEDFSSFAITRNLQQVGLSLSTSTDREVISYTLQGNKDSIEYGFQFLLSVATKQVFKPWELADNVERLQYDLYSLSTEAKLLDLLHKAAYQYGLGNSLYVEPSSIKQINAERLQHFVKSYFIPSRASVTGVGVSHETLVKIANLLTGQGSAPSEPAKPVFHQAEVRSFAPINNAYVAIAGEGAGEGCGFWGNFVQRLPGVEFSRFLSLMPCLRISLNNKDAYAFAALKFALGTGPQIKYGYGVGPLSKATQSFKEPVGISALNLSYSDSGLFGVSFITPGEQAKEVAQTVVKILKSGNVSAEDAKRGIAQLTAAVQLANETNSALGEDLKTQVTTFGSVHDLSAVLKAVSSLSPTDVQNAAKKIAGGKLAVAAVGNINSLPYVDLLVK